MIGRVGGAANGVSTHVGAVRCAGRATAEQLRGTFLKIVFSSLRYFVKLVRSIEGKQRREADTRKRGTTQRERQQPNQARSMATSQSHLSPPSYQHRIVETIRSATEVARGKPRRAQRTSRSSGVSYIYTVRTIQVHVHASFLYCCNVHYSNVVPSSKFNRSVKKMILKIPYFFVCN